jgi:succinoglycan biosynthesis transport protein ExoP
MNWKEEKELIADSDTEHDADRDAKSPGYSEAESISEEADLFDIVRRQWRLIGAIVGAAMIVGAAILWQLTPLYTAHAEVIIEPQRPTLATLEAILPGVGTDEQSIATELVVLTSGVLLDSVIDRLDLVSDPEFNSILDSLEAVTGAEKTRDQSSLQVPADRMRALTKSALLSRLEVAQVGVSRVISVHATSESGDKAAMIANTLVDEYFQSRLDSKFQASSETSSWLEERIADLQTQLRESEQRAERFRSDAELLEAGGTTLISQQLVNLYGQIISARATIATAQAELSQVDELMRSSDSSLLASAGVLRSPLVQELRKQQVALERQIAELSSELGPAHPRMLQSRADAADLENQISIEVYNVVQGLRNSVKVAAAREAGLEREAALLTARLSQLNEDDIQLRALEREAEANQQLLETLLTRRKALGSADLMQTGQPDARVISFATPPITPAFPKFGISMAGIFMVSMIVGFVIAFISEIRRPGISTLEQLEAVSKLRALGFVPHVTSRQQQRGMLVSVVTKPRRPFAQAMKTLNWQMDEGMPESAKVIVVTSPIAGEGKTTTAIAIARIKAIKGHKTIIVDADIRKPTVHTKLNCPPTSGLTDVIEGGSELLTVILPDEESPLEILPAGRSSSDAFGFVESLAMSSVLEELRSQYDYIIVDTPPVAAAPDACILSKKADTTILVVRSLKTPANAVKYALRNLKRNGGHITGTVLTMVETSSALNRNYGYYGYYGYYGEKS